MSGWHSVWVAECLGGGMSGGGVSGGGMSENQEEERGGADPHLVASIRLSKPNWTPVIDSPGDGW